MPESASRQPPIHDEGTICLPINPEMGHASVWKLLPHYMDAQDAGSHRSELRTVSWRCDRLARRDANPHEGAVVKISAILNNIELEQFALPEFQRGYVWGRENVRGLFDSLYRRYPVGGFLVWTTQPEAETVRGDSNPTGAAVKLLLDGQQRATSLYGVMRGEAPQFFQGNERAFTDLYFDVRTQTFEFYGPVKMRDDPLWVSVTDLFKSELEDVVTRVAGHAGDLRVVLEYQTRLMKVLGDC